MEWGTCAPHCEQRILWNLDESGTLAGDGREMGGRRAGARFTSIWGTSQLNDSVLSESRKGARAAESWNVHSVLNPAFDKEHMLYYVQVGTLAVASMSQKAIACTIAQRLPPLSIS